MRPTSHAAKQVAVIVDAYSTGSRLANEFRRFDVACIHVQSSVHVPAEFVNGFVPGDFIRSFVVTDAAGIEEIAAELRGFDLLCVVAGTETGVEVADRLAALLGLPGNDPRTSHLRRDKYEMHAQLEKSGLSTLRQARCATMAEALAWANALQCWPVVVKPLSSGGADGVTFCHDTVDVAAAVDGALGKRNRLGNINTAVVLQEKIHGQQFIVNAVSMEGRHYVSEVWKDDKIAVAGAPLVCDREILLSPECDPIKDLCRYTTACLDALGIREGPSHTELFLTDQGELMLIETAARMQGPIDHESVLEATGHSHVTLTVLRHVRPSTFAQLFALPYRRKKHLHCVTLSATSVGTLKENRCMERLSSLTSFRALIHAPQPGMRIQRTVDLFTNAGITYLSHDDEKVLESDYWRIRRWEADGELFLMHKT
ncbi:ATP-grasp domain-containing protein [Variovorax defluvii]|uniref:ATP-grasp domain-containing protein n=1 Tax=Variovorax defluvii TaxID=913761 RepID=A0ABP8HU57_9BURK